MINTGELKITGEQNPSFRAVLSNFSFMNLWLAQLFSQLADKIILVYLIVLLEVAGFTANSDVSRLTLVFTIPAVLFGSLAGVFVDRWNKKWLMISSNILRGIFVLVLPIALWFKEPSALWIFSFTFLVSTVTQFFAPAEIAMIPHIVEKRNLLAANSLFTTTMLGSVVIGMGVADPILRVVGDTYGHYAIGGMYLISGCFLFFVKPKFHSEHKQEQAGSILKELKEGFDYVLKDRQILLLLIRLIILFSAFAALTILVIGFMKDVLQVEKRYFSYIMAVAGLGMGVSAALVGKFGIKIGKEKLIGRGFLAMGSILIALANIQVISHWFQVASKAGVASAMEISLAFVLAFFLGISAAAIAVPIQTLLQEKTPEHLRGKVFGVQNMLVNTAMTLPMSLAGVLADALDNVSPGNGVIWVMSLVGMILILGAFLKQPKTLKVKA